MRARRCNRPTSVLATHSDPIRMPFLPKTPSSWRQLAPRPRFRGLGNSIEKRIRASSSWSRLWDSNP